MKIDQSARACMLGHEHVEYGRFALAEPIEGRSAATLSIGAGPNTPASSSKGDPQFANEDALLLVDDGDQVLLAVADAHFGWKASHELIEALDLAVDPVPRTPAALAELLGSLKLATTRTRSETTLIVAVLDRVSESGFGVSAGDSTCMVVTDQDARVLNPRAANYLDPSHGARTLLKGLSPFSFVARRTSLLVVFTDGIDECHYRNPQNSIGSTHHRQTYLSTTGEPAEYARSITRLALHGIGGHPGGQDNIALAVARC